MTPEPERIQPRHFQEQNRALGWYQRNLDVFYRRFRRDPDLIMLSRDTNPVALEETVRMDMRVDSVYEPIYCFAPLAYQEASQEFAAYLREHGYEVFQPPILSHFADDIKCFRLKTDGAVNA